MKKSNRSERRASFPLQTSREAKAKLGRTTTSETPFSLRVLGFTVDSSLREYLGQRLGFKLGKFALSTRRISVRLINESGPKGAPAIVCRVKVALDPANDVVVEHPHADVRTAIDGAVDRAERSVRRALEKLRGQGAKLRARRRPKQSA